MIVKIRLEVSEEQRSALSLLLHPKALKRLASRAEFSEYMLGLVEVLTAPEATITIKRLLDHEEPRRSALSPFETDPDLAAMVEPVEPTTGLAILMNASTQASLKPINEMTLEDRPGLKRVAGDLAECRRRANGAPEDPLKAALFKVNAAMFALADARRLTGETSYRRFNLKEAASYVDNARDDLVGDIEAGGS